MSVIGKRYTLINVCEELSGDKVTIIVLHGYREVVSPTAEAAVNNFRYNLGLSERDASDTLLPLSNTSFNHIRV